MYGISKTDMNKIFYSLIVAIAMILTSCAGTYDIKGTSNVSVLDGKMLYLKQYHDSDLRTSILATSFTDSSASAEDSTP